MTNPDGNSISATNASDSVFVGNDKISINNVNEFSAILEYSLQNQERLLREHFSVKLESEISKRKILSLEEEIERKNRIILALQNERGAKL